MDYIRRSHKHIYDHEGHFMQLLTSLFREAEEREEADSTAMLKRVVTLQDVLLGLGLNGMEEWQRNADRP